MQSVEIEKKSVVMLGATGAVGTETVNKLLTIENIERLTLLGRRRFPAPESTKVQQETIDIFDPTSYQRYLAGHDTAICTLGVGEPSKMGREEFLRIDKDAVLDFARGCKVAGIVHFQLLASVAIHPQSRSFYLRTKGELVEELKGLQFERLSVFMPSMILTPTNRYGLSQAITLKIWPLLTPFLMGRLRKYRGIPVERLGCAIASNVITKGSGYTTLIWDDFLALC
ncbi:Rossmann-fold NAD(P)-binding domain-containing protein [Desulforhopalus sp. 52FAK]